MKYCIEGNDRCCHDIILFIGTKEECKSRVKTRFNHKIYGGIDVIISEYKDRLLKLPKDIHD